MNSVRRTDKSPSCESHHGHFPPPLQDRDASRFLAQATFGPTPNEITRLQTLGYVEWLSEQLNIPPEPRHRAYIESLTAVAVVPTDNHIANSFWKQAATAPDSLRQRIAFSLSQIFVVSLVDPTIASSKRGVASYLDMLGEHAFGNFRTLLEGVARHPMMGIYLTHMRNQKEDPVRFRIPDQNFAREVMQLFTIGLIELNPDGTPRLVNGAPVETYTDADVVGLSRVFTGFSWAGPDTLNGRFTGSTNPPRDPNRDILPMQGYPQYHSLSEKRFLGTVIPAGQGNPNESLRIALDTLANHPNVGPFFGRQLIQRLVTSNPSPEYVGRVAQAFDSGLFSYDTWAVGTGVRGDLMATIAAVLLDREARANPSLNDPNFGRVREPILRMANWMRAFNARSTSGNFLLGITDDVAISLGQTVMRSPSVFNFYRPGYVPPNTGIAAAGLVAPEMQIIHETSVIGYANWMRSTVQLGVGTGNPRDIQPDYTAELAIANQPNALIDRLDILLCAGTLSAPIKNLIRNAISSVAIPITNPTAALRNRVWIGVLMTLSAPEYLVQK